MGVAVGVVSREICPTTAKSLNPPHNILKYLKDNKIYQCRDFRLPGQLLFYFLKWFETGLNLNKLHLLSLDYFTKTYQIYVFFLSLGFKSI